MTHQLSFLQPTRTSTRHRPRGQRKGESWFAYCVRDETWRRLNAPDRTPAERAARQRINDDFRENCLRSAEVFCYRQIESAKKTNTPGAIWFWFGGEIGYPGMQSQYVNETGMKYILAQPARIQKRGKRRVGFGPCGL